MSISNLKIDAMIVAMWIVGLKKSDVEMFCFWPTECWYDITSVRRFLVLSLLAGDGRFPSQPTTTTNKKKITIHITTHSFRGDDDVTSNAKLKIVFLILEIYQFGYMCHYRTRFVRC
jgi:hypothetical protein